MIGKLRRLLTANTEGKRYLLYKFLVRLGLCKRINTVLNGTPIIVPIIGGAGLDNVFMEEPWMTQLIATVYRLKPGTFIDVGVNLGQTLIKYKSLRATHSYLGFEPNPSCYLYAKELVRLNGFRHTELFPVGVADRSDVVTLYSSSQTDPAASMVEDFRDPRQYSMKTTVLIMSADEIVGKLMLDSISALKIDVEGAELDVLRGFESTLATYQPFILCEILPVYDAETKNGKFRKRRQDEIESILTRHGYSIFRTLVDGTFVPLSTIGVHGDLALSNYVFVPQEAVAGFRHAVGLRADI